MLEKQLQNLGFHKNETIIYLALFELGKCKAADLIKKTKLHRNLVYTALETLEQKRLITKLEKGKVAVFEVNSPEAIKNLIEQKVEIANDLIQELNKKLTSTPRNIQVYEGNEGIIKTREDFARNIQKNESYRVMGVSYSNSNPEITDYFAKFNKYILKKGADFKVLVAGNEDKKIISDRGLTWQTNARYLPFSINSPMWMALFRDTLNISIVGDNPVTFSIQSKEAAEGFRKYFDYFWNQETIVLNGAEALKDLWLEAIDCKELKWIGARGYTIDNYPEIFKEILEKANNTPGIIWKNIIDPEFKGHILTKLPWVETKYTLSKTRSPIPIWLFGNKVLIVNWAEKEPIIFLSTNKSLVQSYNDYFEELWNK